jgi:uncharacterized protein (TIGR03067 family)
MMASRSAHPPKDQLMAFGQGKLAADESSQVEQHLGVCPECCETLLDLKDDTFTGLVRAARPAQRELPPAVAVVPDLDAADDTEPGAEHSARPDGADVASAGTVCVPASDAREAGDLPIELANHPRYRIVELIGRGGMGSVYRAEHRLMNRPVAIKVINSQLVQNAKAVERFRREVQAAAKLSHPNIVAAYDAEQAGSAHFLAMEFVDGTDLATVVQQRGPLPVAEACEYIRQAAVGLQHAHELALVHRDIKPHNLMVVGQASSLSGRAEGKLGAYPTIKILDFGLAGFVTEAAIMESEATAADSGAATISPHLTALGSVMGTPDYIAPEQASDAHSADIRADIYSLGCSLYFLLTARPPYEADGAAAKLMAHVELPVPDLRSQRPDVAPQLTAVVSRMIAKKPADRFQTPAEVAAALAPFTRQAEAPPRKRTLRNVLAAAAATLLAGVIYITTDKGRIEIRTDVNDVDIVVSQGGNEVKTIDLATGSQIKWMPSGDYTISLKQDRNDIQITPSGFTLSRWGKQIVSISRSPAAGVTPAADAAQGLPSGVVDQMLLQGLWIAVSGHVGGQPISAEQLPKFSIEIDQDQVTITPPGNPSLVRRGTFKNNATSTLRRIDIVAGDKKEPIAGIYEVDQKRLKVALVNGDESRPTDFAPSDRPDHLTGVFERAPHTGMSEYVEFKPAGLNGSFEVTKFGLPVNWGVYTPRTVPNGDFDIVVDKTDFKEGEQSLKFVVRKCEPTGGRLSPGFFNDFRITNFTPPGPFETKPGETYKVSFWAKNAGSEFVLKARGVSAREGDKGAIIRSKETFNEWRRFECTYTIPLKPKMHLRLELNVVQPGTFWIDDIQVVKVDETAAVPDEQRLQGKWVPVSCLYRGKPFTAEQLARMAITFDRDRASMTDPDSGREMPGTFTIDATRSPRHIDLIAPDGKERLPGIFEFDGEQLKMAWCDGDYARPTNFVPAQTPDHMTVVLKRVPGGVPATAPQDEPVKPFVPDEKQLEAVKAAEAYLSVMDEGKFGSLRDMVSLMVRQQVTREQLSQTYQKLRDTFGKAVQRTLTRVQLYDEFPGLPQGRYALVQYKTDCERQKGLWESLLLNLDTDGKWRVNTYALTLEPMPFPDAESDPAIEQAIEQKKQAAMAAAQEWLNLVDAAKYAESWEASAKINRDGISKQKMVDAYREMFKPLGSLKSRDYRTREYKTGMPGAPVGEYMVIQFRTQFANGRVTETVVLIRESDGQWRVSSYFHAGDNSVPTLD